MNAGQREDGAGCDRFADGAGGSREVLFEDAAFAEDSQDGHADDGGGIGGGDGHAGAQSEIGVGGAEDDAQHESDQYGSDA